MKTIKMRGQAFVVFKDTRSASKAIDGGHGVNLFGKPMEICFAKTKSKKLLEYQGKTVQAMAISKKPNAYKYRNDRSHHNQNRFNKNKNDDQYSRLRIEDIPLNPNLHELEKIFSSSKFDGFRRIIYDESKPGFCFVEYENQNQSIRALETLQGLDFNGHTLRITVDNYR